MIGGAYGGGWNVSVVGVKWDGCGHWSRLGWDIWELWWRVGCGCRLCVYKYCGRGTPGPDPLQK